MGIRVEYTIHELPPSYVTKEKVYKYVPSEDDPKIKVRTEEEIEHRGGFLVKFMRGHSLRFYDKAHLAAFNAAMRGSGHRDGASFQINTDGRARLVDENSGQVVNAQGIPEDIQHLVAPVIDGGAADEDGGLFDGDAGDGIEASVGKE